MKKQKRFNVYGDGYIVVCAEKETVSDFAKLNVRKSDDLNKVMKLAYEERSRRDQDIDFANSIGRSLNMKIKTPLRTEVKQTHLIMIGRMIYSIINLDYDKANNEMYLYLEEVREVAE